MRSRSIALPMTIALWGCAHVGGPEGALPCGEIRGEVASVDPYERQVTVTTTAGPMQLQATDRTALVDPKGVGWTELRELHPGERVLADFELTATGTREMTRLTLLSDQRQETEAAEPAPAQEVDPDVNPPAGGLSPMPAGRE
ncbi:MAG: hypothetical protein ACYCWW_03500 [Deltaproteobacteria bacterium]